MNAKLLMGASALTMLLAGLALTFAPRELLLRLQNGSSPALVLLLQANGAE